jgi:hypothetical protein
VFTIHDFFDVQTVPTLRHEVTKSKFPQRISTSLSRKGLTLNYHSHIIRPDIVRPPPNTLKTDQRLTIYSTPQTA